MKITPEELNKMIDAIFNEMQQRQQPVKEKTKTPLDEKRELVHDALKQMLEDKNSKKALITYVDHDGVRKQKIMEGEELLKFLAAAAADDRILEKGSFKSEEGQPENTQDTVASNSCDVKSCACCGETIEDDEEEMEEAMEGIENWADDAPTKWILEAIRVLTEELQSRDI